MQIINKYKKYNKSNSSGMLKQTLNYLTGNVMIKCINFISTPILTRLLIPSDYGMLSVFNSFTSIFTIILGLSIESGIKRYYFESDSKEYRKVLGSNIIFISVLNIINLVLFLIINQFIEVKISGVNTLFMTMAILISMMNIFYNIYMAHLQITEKSKEYATINVIKSILTIFISIPMIISLTSEKYMGQVYTLFIIAFVFFIYSFVNIKKIAIFNFELKDIKYTLRFSVPLIPAAISSFLLAYFDRIMIQQFVNDYSAGIYSFAYNVSMLIQVVIVSVNKSWNPVFFKLYRDKKYSQIEHIAIKYSLYIFMTALILICFSKEVVLIMADKSYFEAIDMIPVIILGYVFVYLYTLYFQYNSYYKKTGLISVYNIIAAGINILLNYIFIPKYGYIAAAYTTLISYIVLFLLYYINVKYIIRCNAINIAYIVIECSVFILFVFGYILLSNLSYMIMLILKVVLCIVYALYIIYRLKRIQLKNINYM